MKDIIDTLKEFGDIAHWRMGPADERHGGNPACPPIIVWRYKKPAQELADLLQRIVRTVPGTIAWEFSIFGQNWMLMPARINEYATGRGDIGGRDAVLELMKNEPEFGQRANAELPLLAQHIQQQLEQVRAG